MLERKRRKPDRWGWAITAVVVLYLGGLLIAPLGALVVGVFSDLDQVIRVLKSRESLNALGLTLILAVLSIVLNGLFGVAGALVMTRQRFLGRRLLDALVDLPLAVSPVMTGLAFLLLFGRTGWLRPVIDAVDLQVAFAFPGLLLATLFVTLPFTFREVALLLDELGTSEEEAAATLGASPWRTFWSVTLPNMRPGLVLGTTLTTARALGEFGAVLVLGGSIANHTQTATTFIHAAIEERQEPAAYGMALILAAAAVALLLLLQRKERSRA